MKNIQYLLLQARKEQDPMIENEKKCFLRTLGCEKKNIKTKDIIRDTISEEDFKRADAVIIGGSGDFSIVKGGEWINKALDIMNYLYENSKVTFASCWGFQAMAKARGGEVVKDLQRAELGTIKIWLTTNGMKDEVFKILPKIFLTQMGHEDIVERLPNDAVLLASSEKVKNEAFRFDKKPIYCTQFHPELNKNDLKERMETYPAYIEKILGISKKEFINTRCFDSKDTEKLLLNFINTYFD